jgi:hypothetical protein
MSHGLKMVLDCIFDEKNFINEITWQRAQSKAKGSQYGYKTWGNITDIIFFYTKTADYHLFPLAELTDKTEIEKLFNKVDEHGDRYNTTIPVFCSKSMGARPNLCFEWKGLKNPHPSGWRLSKARLEEEYKKGNIVISNNKIERRKYLKDYEGQPVGNLWHDIPFVSGNESTGYPTQKPLALLERIIKASSKEGDVVLDPFCGCATTCVAAEKLGRKWIGIDVSKKAYELVQIRMVKEIPSELWDGKSTHYYETNQLKRTDGGGRYKEKKYVYILEKKSELPYYKVGIAKDIKARLSSYQTADKDRDYKMVYTFSTTYYREIEKHIHKSFESLHEWVRAKKDAIIFEIEKCEKNLENKK